MTDFLQTDDVTGADRFETWRRWVSATYVPLECARVSREPFRGQIASWALGDLRVSRVTATPHLASRTRRMIALREDGLYKVGLLTRGSGTPIRTRSQGRSCTSPATAVRLSPGLRCRSTGACGSNPLLLN